MPDDLYALGAVVYLLLTGKLPECLPLTPIEKLRRDVPAAVREVIVNLLGASPLSRPKASTVAEVLAPALSAFGDIQAIDRTPQHMPATSAYTGGGAGVRLSLRMRSANLASERSVS